MQVPSCCALIYFCNSESNYGNFYDESSYAYFYNDAEYCDVRYAYADSCFVLCHYTEFLYA